MSSISAGTTSTTTLVHSGDTTGSLVFKTNDTGSGGTTAVTIDTSQRVGIGTASPTQALTVAGQMLSIASSGASFKNITPTTGNNYMWLGNTGNNLYVGKESSAGGSLFVGSSAYAAVIGNDGAYPLQFATNNNVQATIDSSGNVGIGTSSPTSLLTVHNGSVLLRSAVTTGALNNYTLGFSATATGGAAAYLTSYRESANDASALVFGTWNGSAAGERMRIDSSGNLLVGTTAVNNTNGFSIAPSTAPYVTLNKSATGTKDAFYFEYNGAIVGKITYSDTATAYNTSSDYRLKENIQPMQNALGKVARLNPVTYKWKLDGSDGEGFIAHELAEVCPHAVTGEKDAVDADGNPVYQGIDTSFLVATLTAAIQEQQALITAQAETINALTARVVALEQKGTV